MDLARQGYVEEEFFLAGTARTYDIPRDQMSNGTPSDATHPFKTRIVVRRPAAAAKFNGTVIVEWTNVSEGFDNEVEWFHSGEHFVRSGYAWVGVSAQNVGVTALKQRMARSVQFARRHRQRDRQWRRFVVRHLHGRRAGRAGQIRRERLGPLKAERVIASGHSQSAGRLATYFNVGASTDARLRRSLAAWGRRKDARRISP